MSLIERRSPCWTAECDECSTPLEDEFHVHADSETDVIGTAEEYGWTYHDGRIYCSDCWEKQERRGRTL